MSHPPPSSSPERSRLLLDFPVRLYTALRTMRLYPASNPQVQRSIDFLVKAHVALLAAEGGDSITIAISDQKLLVCGDQLPERDQARPQIQGLITFIGRLKIHSFTFHAGFTFDVCLVVVQTLAPLLSEKELAEPLAQLLDKAGITAVTVDVKRYVAIHEGEQVVREEMLGSGLQISDEELTNFVLGKTENSPFDSISAELIKDLLSRLPPGGDHRHSEQTTRAVIETLKSLSRETDPQKRRAESEHSAELLSGLDPGLLAQLVATLPPSPAADEVLGTTLQHLSPGRLNTLIANLVTQQKARGMNSAGNSGTADQSTLRRLLDLEAARRPEIRSAIDQNLDARHLLDNPNTTLAELPEHLLVRLKDPQWSAPVLATAAQQMADPTLQADGQVDIQAFNSLLDRYEQLLGKEQQTQVARQAGAQLASMEALALGNILAQKFKGMFGEQVYGQLISQITDAQLDETVERLSPQQLNRLIAALSSEIPLHLPGNAEGGAMPAGDLLLKRLARSKKGPEISRSFAQHRDARTLLENPDTTLAELPPHLLSRLKEPEWSAPVLANAARQAADPALQEEGRVDIRAFNNLLGRYEQLLGKEQQTEVARQAGAQLASMEALALGNLLAQKFKGLFGEQVYGQLVSQVSDALLDETIEHLSPKQLNRLVATLTSEIPLQVSKGDDPDALPVDDVLFKRLAATSRGPEITRAVAQHRDARQLLENPGTTLAELPEHLLSRLKEPQWSAPVLACAVRQVADPDLKDEGPADMQAFNGLLSRYQQLLGTEEQSLVARQAGAQMASMESLTLANVLAQRFKGLFGEQVYRQLISQVSDELLDETIEHLSPKQLNRLIATLTSDIPLQVGKERDPDFIAADDALLQRLAQTKRGPEISRAIAQNLDARQLLRTPEATLAELSAPLLARLKESDWSAPVLASAARQVADPEIQGDDRIDFEAFNCLLQRYEQLLDREQQARVARQAGAQFASMEGLTLSNILAQKFRGLFGEQLYQQVLSQVPDELLDETIEHLTPKQLNRMIAALVSDIPLQVGSRGDQKASLADNTLFRRLAKTSKGPEISRTISQNLDARQLLTNPDTTLAELPPHLLARLKEPEWSAPVLVTAAQQVADPAIRQETGVDFQAFNSLLARYEELLSREQQGQVARQAGAQLASMEGTTLGNILAQRFRGLFGEQLYQQVTSQLTDELLDATVERLSPKQLNRMIAVLTSNIPLQVGKEQDPEWKPADETLLKRLAQTRKGPEISRAIAHNLDAHLLRARPGQAGDLPDQLVTRLQQPAWSAPVLVTAAQHCTDPDLGRRDATESSSFEQVLDQYSSLLNQEKQLQVADQVGAQIAAFEDQELGMLLVQKYKSLFGEQLYRRIITHLSDDKLERLVKKMQGVMEGQGKQPGTMPDQDVEEAYNRLVQAVRDEKMRAIVALDRERREQKEQRRQETIRGGLDRLLAGNLEDLGKMEFRQMLPETVKEMLTEHQEAEADNLLMHLAVGLQDSQPATRILAGQSLTAIAEQLAHLGHWQRLNKLLPALKQAIREKGVSQESIQQAMTAIGALCGQSLLDGKYAQAWELVHFLNEISTSTQAGRVPARETLKALSSQSMLEQLLEHYLHSPKHQEMAGKILVEMGVESAKFQLGRLMSSESRFERKRLLSLIKQTGNPAVSLLLEQLNQESPWYVLRNVVRLLGEIGNPALFAMIRPFIGHSDLRVQQEVLNSAMKIGGDNLRDFLLQALSTIDDTLKIKVVNHIATAHDERFVRPLTDLLESTKPFLGKNKNDLQIALCNTLGTIGSKRATTSLSRVMQSKNVLGLTGYSDEVRKAAEQALEQIRLTSKSSRDQEEEESELEQRPGKADAGSGDTGLKAGIAQQEQAILALAARGERDQARSQLLDLISSAARSGDFQTAERLRDRIYEIDQLALGDIIRSGELIEEEKKGPAKGADLDIWANLTDQLGTEEFQVIYKEFEEKTYKPEETIVAQGEKNDTLFFINQGSIKVSHLADRRELFITTLNRGQIAGENFFTPSVWTVTLTSLTPSRVYVLTQEALANWQDQFPRLRAKLQEFYNQGNNIRSMLEKKGLERRRDQRFTLSRKIQVQPISHLDNPIGRGFRAETADISLGGLSFLIRIARQENARLLLGRRMQVVLPVGGKAKFHYLKGLVIAIQPHQAAENDFSVHFKFDLPLESQGLQNIIG